MLNNEWVVAGALMALLTIGLLLPRRRPKNDENAVDKNRGKRS